MKWPVTESLESRYYNSISCFRWWMCDLIPVRDKDRNWCSIPISASVSWYGGQADGTHYQKKETRVKRGTRSSQTHTTKKSSERDLDLEIHQKHLEMMEEVKQHYRELQELDELQKQRFIEYDDLENKWVLLVMSRPYYKPSHVFNIRIKTCSMIGQ